MLDTNSSLVIPDEDIIIAIEFTLPMNSEDLFSGQQDDYMQNIDDILRIAFCCCDDLFTSIDILMFTVDKFREVEKRLVEKKVRKRRKLSETSDGGRKLMSIYMESASRFGLLNIDDEVDLVKRMREGDESARERLIKCNLRLVVKIAHDYKGKGLPIEDLVQEGNIGLIKGIDKYELGHGAKISSYAAWWIKQGMKRALANQSRTIRIPVQSANKIIKIRASEEKLKCRLNKDPSNAELAIDTNLSLKTIDHLRNKVASVVSLDAPVGEDENFTHEHIIKADNDDFLKRELIKELYEAIEQLPATDQFVIMERFGLEDGEKRTLNEISLKLNRTRERVRQIQCSAINKLRVLLKDSVE